MDLPHIGMAVDFRSLVLDCLYNVNELYKSQRFTFHSRQCASLCDELIEGMQKKVQLMKTEWSMQELNDPQRKNVQRAWKQIYRAVKEAEMYLKQCSTQNWWTMSVSLCNTGEAYTLHIHDLSWSLLCLHFNFLCLENLDERKLIRDFYSKMSLQFGYELQDYTILWTRRNRTAAITWLQDVKEKNKFKVLDYLERRLKGLIKKESVNDSGIPAWLQIPPQHLIPKKRAIGEGSFGKVYEGSWHGLKVAVKEIPIDCPDVFETEVAALGKLQSPFIVQLIGTCIQDKNCYLVMELVSSNLDKILKGRSKPLTLPVAVDLMLQISRGMEYLHSKGIMHLDLKASNILIQPSAVPELKKEGYGRVKLCDFGTASLRLHSFRSSDPKGTCYWRAPEAFPYPVEKLVEEIDSIDEYTYKADVYGFAMTCYEILTGKQPFEGVPPKDLYKMIVQGKRPILKPPSCPVVLANYIQKCWDTDPSRRPCFVDVSNFMRNMKLFLMRLNDPEDWFAESGQDFYSPDVYSELVNCGKETLNESAVDPSSRGPRRLVFLEAQENFEMDDLLRASAEVLWKGSFGTTYRASLMDSSVDVVVKRIKIPYAGTRRHFEEYIQMVGSLKHPNLLSLKAYYYSRDEKLLVYDYLSSGSLYDLLHGRTGRAGLEWSRRMKIAVDAARGLAFLHRSFVTHGNVKSSNILLDGNGNARMAYFGLAGLLNSSMVPSDSAGYRAPEQRESGKISQEADVYSFGVVLLELITGKHPSQNLVKLVRNDLKREEWTAEVLDPEVIRKEGVEEEMIGTVRVALECSCEERKRRPKMSDVVKILALSNMS